MKHLQLFENFKKSTDLKSLIETIKDHLKISLENAMTQT